MNLCRSFPLFLMLSALVAAPVLGQTTRTLRSAQELREAVSIARPGDRIFLADGRYDLQGDLSITQRGAPGSPIRIEAQHRGKAAVVGTSRFILTAAEHIVIEGLDFQGTIGPAIELRGCQHIRITRNTFHLNESQRSSWVFIDGIVGDSVRLSGHNRIDHNLFEKKSHLGNFITIEGTMRAYPQVSQYDRIDRNLFADIGPRVENALEAIRVGSSQYSFSSGFTVLENNLFERCDGDPEYISIKSSDDTIRHNTFRECLGSLSLRHGNRNIVEGNYILGNGRTGSFLDSTGKMWTLGAGGVRFYGTGMRIISNYFEGLTGTRWDATMAITSGNAEYGDGQPLTKHFRIRDARIAFNTMVNNAGNIEIGYDGGGFQGNWWRLPPAGVEFEGNVIVGGQGPLIEMLAQPADAIWKDNIVWPTGSATAGAVSSSGVRIEDPHLVRIDGILQPPHQPARPRPLERKDVGPWAD